MTLPRESDSPHAPRLRRYDATVRHGGDVFAHSFTEWSVHDVLAKLAKLVESEPASPPAGHPLTIEIRRLG